MLFNIILCHFQKLNQIFQISIGGIGAMDQLHFNLLLQDGFAGIHHQDLVDIGSHGSTRNINTAIQAILNIDGSDVRFES